MESIQLQRFQAHMADLQPRVPEWCKCEQMEMSVSQHALWHNERKERGAAACRKNVLVLLHSIKALCLLLFR